jgi:hypothetical protein
MRRSPLLLLFVIYSNFKDILKVFKRQKISMAMIIAIILTLLALVFSFIAFSPMLSPFLYPLF